MLYVYVKKTLRLPEGSPVTLSQVAELYQDDGSGTAKWDALGLGTVGKDVMLITCVDLYKAIALDANSISIVGADACCVSPEVPLAKGFQLFWKVALISLILFAGAGLTIMNYHSDVHMQGVHETLAEILTGSQLIAPWISVMYCVGVAGGVLFFSNLIPGKHRPPSIFDIEQFEMETQTENYERYNAEKGK